VPLSRPAQSHRPPNSPARISHGSAHTNVLYGNPSPSSVISRCSASSTHKRMQQARALGVAYKLVSASCTIRYAAPPPPQAKTEVRLVLDHGLQAFVSAWYYSGPLAHEWHQLTPTHRAGGQFVDQATNIPMAARSSVRHSVTSSSQRGIALDQLSARPLLAGEGSKRWTQPIVQVPRQARRSLPRGHQSYTRPLQISREMHCVGRHTACRARSSSKRRSAGEKTSPCAREPGSVRQPGPVDT